MSRKIPVSRNPPLTARVLPRLRVSAGANGALSLLKKSSGPMEENTRKMLPELHFLQYIATI